MADVYVCTDWNGLGEYGAVVVLEVNYYLKRKPGTQTRDPRFTPMDEVPFFEVRALRRYREETFESVYRDMAEYRNREAFLAKEVELVVGVNEFGAVIDHMLDESDVDDMPTLMNIGAQAERSRVVDDIYEIPRHELVTTVMLAYNADRVRVADQLELLPVLDQQLLQLRTKTDTGQLIRRDSGESDDDLARSLAMGVFLAQQEHETRKDYEERLDQDFPTAGAGWDPYTWRRS